MGLFLAVAARAAAAYGPGLVVDAEWGIGDLTAALPGGERWVAPAALAALVRRRLPGVLGQAIRSPSVLDPDPPLPAPAAWQEVLAAADPWQGWYLGRDPRRPPVLQVLEHLDLVLLVPGTGTGLVPALRLAEVLRLAVPRLAMAAAGLGGSGSAAAEWRRRTGLEWWSLPEAAGPAGGWPRRLRSGGLRAAERGPR
ncbi:protein of unknown function [Candidatus Hydrogenisulfobacillus filiaventi]|uniref:Uncharacterized protein n=1 Tax=Candidatus Hydrogenisulfobacillus filiaventi TaxID=2707344 RepID=A0A6F8ZGY9_9FIRM|nr:protein of unknown function [Candidatus Hydrogenisulfobacillus filiaventi]